MVVAAVDAVAREAVGGAAAAEEDVVGECEGIRPEMDWNGLDWIAVIRGKGGVGGWEDDWGGQRRDGLRLGRKCSGYGDSDCFDGVRLIPVRAALMGWCAQVESNYLLPTYLPIVFGALLARV